MILSSLKVTDHTYEDCPLKQQESSPLAEWTINPGLYSIVASMSIVES